MFTGLTVPAEASTGPALEMPTRSTLAPCGPSRIVWTAAESASATASAPPPTGVGTSATSST